ncbi:MAG: tRNA (guanosine(37)-N1)-methyltransferase TrmD [Acidobacteria bacterium]|nr:tRNA (guanosine(37)-N1)-methyltransferase TrmD [Acidobacteriota bacterium]
MIIDCLSIFPDIVSASLGQSIVGKACDKGLLEIRQLDIRDFTTDKHHSVDDIPYGGGAGMVFKPEPVIRALKSVWRKESRVIHPSPAAPRFDQEAARLLAQEEHLIFIASRYEGLDQRVIDAWVDLEYSLGDFVITGGELATSVFIDAIVRMIPGAVGKHESVAQDSYYNGLLDYPHYTRPEELDGMRVPDVLLSGHHENIRQWRKRQSIQRTQRLRPDLLQQSELDQESLRWLGEDS